jgi:hypothetical protein
MRAVVAFNPTALPPREPTLEVTTMTKTLEAAITEMLESYYENSAAVMALTFVVEGFEYPIVLNVLEEEGEEALSIYTSEIMEAFVMAVQAQVVSEAGALGSFASHEEVKAAVLEGPYLLTEEVAFTASAGTHTLKATYGFEYTGAAVVACT